jgi:hypothetical protein
VIYSEKGDCDSASQTEIPANLRVFEMISTDGAERTTTANDSAIMQKLLEFKEMGDRTPSQFYKDLKDLATPSTPDDFILKLWENRLPMHVQHVLAAVQNRNAKTRTQIADVIHENRPNAGRIVTVSANRTTAVTDQPAQKVGTSNPLAAAINEMNEQMARIETKMKALNLDRTRPARRRIRSQRKSNLKNQLRSLGLCYYHAVFQEHAKKCRFPCAWNTKNGTKNTKIRVILRYMAMNI